MSRIPPPAPAPLSTGIRAPYARLVVDYLRALDIDPHPTQAALGLTPQQLADPAARVPARRLTCALEQAARLTGDPHAPMAIGRQVRPAHLGPLGYALVSSVDPTEGLALFERLQHQVCDEVRVTHVLRGDVIESHHEVVGDVPRTYAFWSFVAAARLAFVRWVIGRHLVPLALDLPCPAPADPRPFDEFVGVPVRYGAAVCREHMPAHWLSLPNPNADPALHRLMTALSDQPPSPREDIDAVLQTVRQQIRARLAHTGAPTLEDLADVLDQALGLSVRQVQRRLAELGLSYKEVLEAVRREQVLHELRHTALPLATVAERAGYLEISSFHRAVRRWTGTTPSSVRAGAPSAHPPADPLLSETPDGP